MTHTPGYSSPGEYLPTARRYDISVFPRHSSLPPIQVVIQCCQLVLSFLFFLLGLINVLYCTGFPVGVVLQMYSIQFPVI